MKNKIFLALGASLLIFLAVALFKDFVYDTPQRCYGTVAGEFGGTAERASAAMEGDFVLLYKINYMALFPMGTLTISKKDGDAGPVFKLQATTDNSLADTFVRATASLESFFDAETNFPVRYIETTQVNEVIKTKEIEFDRENRIAVREGNKIRIEENTYDPVGAFLAAVNFPYMEGQNYLLSVLSKNALYLLRAKKIGSSGSFFKAVIDVKREDMTSSHGATLNVWLTESAPRIPLVIKCWTPAGYASVTLEKIENTTRGSLNRE